MAPRKRGRQAASTDVDEGANSESHANIKAADKKNAAKSRQWTDEQEIALLKSIIKWKPVGPSIYRDPTPIFDHRFNAT